MTYEHIVVDIGMELLQLLQAKGADNFLGARQAPRTHRQAVDSHPDKRHHTKRVTCQLTSETDGRVLPVGSDHDLLHRTQYRWM